jgi:hypothetical protein
MYFGGHKKVARVSGESAFIFHCDGVPFLAAPVTVFSLAFENKCRTAPLFHAGIPLFRPQTVEK